MAIITPEQLKGRVKKNPTWIQIFQVIYLVAYVWCRLPFPNYNHRNCTNLVLNFAFFRLPTRAALKATNLKEDRYLNMSRTVN